MLLSGYHCQDLCVNDPDRVQCIMDLNDIETGHESTGENCIKIEGKYSSHVYMYMFVCMQCTFVCACNVHVCVCMLCICVCTCNVHVCVCMQCICVCACNVHVCVRACNVYVHVHCVYSTCVIRSIL